MWRLGARRHRESEGLKRAPGVQRLWCSCFSTLAQKALNDAIQRPKPFDVWDLDLCRFFYVLAQPMGGCPIMDRRFNRLQNRQAAQCLLSVGPMDTWSNGIDKWQ